MPATTTPNGWASSFGCGYCGISFQCLEPVLDDNGNQRYNDEGDRALVCNDEAKCSIEINEHIDNWHPETDEVDEYGNPVRKHLGQQPE